MNEERELAAKAGVDSPVWDSLAETHASYNGALEHVLPSMKPNDRVVIASHNVDSVELAKQIMAEENISKEQVMFG